MIKPRPNIEKMQGYTPGEQPENMDEWIKLNTNENPYPPSPLCNATLKLYTTEGLRRYPNPTADELRKTIASLFGFDYNQILVGNGSDDVLNLVFRAYAIDDAEIAVLTPSYSLYPTLAEIQNVKVRYIQLNEDFSLPDNFSTLLENVTAVFIPSPNAPTGIPFPKESLRTICNQINAIIVIDEAYADFAEENVVDFVNEFDNVIISRTFSKSYSLAGLRVGFAISRAEIISQLMKVKDSYNVGILPQIIAQAALDDQDYLKENVKKIINERIRTTEKLTELGFKVSPSQANFVFVRPPDDNGFHCYEYLKTHRILVRFFNHPNTKEYIRITIGTPEQMNELFKVLESYS